MWKKEMGRIDSQMYVETKSSSIPISVLGNSAMSSAKNAAMNESGSYCGRSQLYVIKRDMLTAKRREGTYKDDCNNCKYQKRVTLP